MSLELRFAYVHVFERAHGYISSVETFGRFLLIHSQTKVSSGETTLLEPHSDVNDHHVERLKSYFFCDLIHFTSGRDLMEIRTEVSSQRPNQSKPSSILH